MLQGLEAFECRFGGFAQTHLDSSSAELLIQHCGLITLPDGISTLPLLRTLILEGDTADDRECYQHRCSCDYS